MSAPNFIPPVDRVTRDETPDGVNIPLSPPLAAIVMQLEALRASFNAQIDAVLAQVQAVAYTGAAINNARGGRARSAGDAPAMPATFGARPSPREASPSDAGAHHEGQSEQRDDGERAERAIERLG